MKLGGHGPNILQNILGDDECDDGDEVRLVSSPCA